MMRRISILTILSTATFFSVARADQLTLGAASGYNVFVFNNFSEYNTDAQGTMAVGGNFAPSNGGSFTIAGGLNNGAGAYDLVVGGNFTMTGNSMGGGDIYVGGNMTWNNPSLPHDAYVAGDFTNGTNGGSTNGTIYYGGKFSSGDALTHAKDTNISAPIDFLSAKTSLASLSTTLAADTPTGSVNHSYSTYTLTGTSSTLNVFNLTDSSYSGATINITAPAGSTVVVNVAGTADSFNGGSINLNGVRQNDVIFNFSAATSLSLSGIAFNGSILAPNADFTGSWGQINGELIALSAAGTTQLNNEVFNGYLASTGGSGTGTTGQTATPEPSTWVMIGSGLLAVAFFNRKRARIAN
jgi:choice-of-anchor A domain-containing protein